MESQPQNPEFRINPENFHPCTTGLTENQKFPSYKQLIEYSVCALKSFCAFRSNKVH